MLIITSSYTMELDNVWVR